MHEQPDTRTQNPKLIALPLRKPKTRKNRPLLKALIPVHLNRVVLHHISCCCASCCVLAVPHCALLAATPLADVPLAVPLTGHLPLSLLGLSRSWASLAVVPLVAVPLAVARSRRASRCCCTSRVLLLRLSRCCTSCCWPLARHCLLLCLSCCRASFCCASLAAVPLSLLALSRHVIMTVIPVCLNPTHEPDARTRRTNPTHEPDARTRHP